METGTLFLSVIAEGIRAFPVRTGSSVATSGEPVRISEAHGLRWFAHLYAHVGASAPKWDNVGTFQVRPDAGACRANDRRTASAILRLTSIRRRDYLDQDQRERARNTDKCSSSRGVPPNRSIRPIPCILVILPRHTWNSSHVTPDFQPTLLHSRDRLRRASMTKTLPPAARTSLTRALRY